MLNSHISSHRKTYKNWWFLKITRTEKQSLMLSSVGAPGYWYLTWVHQQRWTYTCHFKSPQKNAGIYAFVFVTAFSGMCWLYNHHLRGAYHIIKNNHPTERLKIIYLRFEYLTHTRPASWMTWFNIDIVLETCHTSLSKKVRGSIEPHLTFHIDIIVVSNISSTLALMESHCCVPLHFIRLLRD